MAITKNELSDFVRDIVLGGDPTLSGKIHPTVIWKAADTVIGKLIENSMFKDKDSNGYDVLGDFVSVHKNVEVKTDTDTDERYSLLPAPIISLKQDRGLVRVSEMKSSENAFAIVGNSSHDVFSILDVHYLNKKTEVYLEGNRLVYRNLGTSVNKVLVKMVSGITALDGDDPIAVPASLEADLIAMVVDILRPSAMTPQDKTNDNNSNIPT